MTTLEDLRETLLLHNAACFDDERGWFEEVWSRNRKTPGHNFDPRYVNVVNSRAGVVRGLHYQQARPQAKLVSCVQGEILDVLVDLRKSSETFGQALTFSLTGDIACQVFVPRGFAHGYCAIKDSIVLYLTDSDYIPKDERVLLWSDPALQIEWPVSSRYILSDKDKEGLTLNQLVRYGFVFN